MVEVARINNVIVVECGYKPPRVKKPELWYNIYIEGDQPYCKTLPFKTHWSIGDAFNHMVELAF